MDDVTNDVTDEVVNRVTNNLINNVTDDFTDDLTNDMSKARHISDLIEICCRMNSGRNITDDSTFMFAFAAIARRGIPDITGSCAELYIDPGETCIGDVDLMCPMTYHIAACDGSAAAVCSVDIGETMQVTLIEPSDCPNGYVYLRVFGERQFNWETGKFEFFVFNDTRLYLQLPDSFFFEADELHGPAKLFKSMSPKSRSTDIVAYIRLLAWPPVAQSWIQRDRNYAWPSNAIVSEVQQNGCDVVHVSHRDYKHDNYQWRYSFSRAEVILIRNWTPIQQLVYHMLRYFTKQTIISEWKDDDEVVCTYHIKTMMLWACERKSPVWWESNCVLVLCSKLLSTFMRWVSKKICPHYFIPKWNLFDYTMKESRRLDTIETLRIHTNVRTLSEWFRINYLFKVFENSHRFISIDIGKRQHFSGSFVASYLPFQVLQTIVQNWLLERNITMLQYIHNMAYAMHNGSPHWKVTQFYMLIYSRNLAPELQILNLAITSLRLAWNIFVKRESELSNHELLDVLSEVVLKLSGQETSNSSPPYNIPFKQCSKWYFIKGVRLLSIHCKGHSAAFCLWMKTCKRYFKSALRIQDEYSESIHDACHAGP